MFKTNPVPQVPQSTDPGATHRYLQQLQASLNLANTNINLLSAKFNSDGHNHDGTDGMGAIVSTTPLSANLPLSITGNVLSIALATTSANGYLSSTDWNNFNTAYTNSHTHSNKAVIDGITSTLISNWNGAVSLQHTQNTDTGTTSTTFVVNSAANETGNFKLTLSSAGYGADYLINSTRTGYWDTAYGWGNHANLYLPLNGGTMVGGIIMSTSSQKITFINNSSITLYGNNTTELVSDALSLTLNFGANESSNYKLIFTTAGLNADYTINQTKFTSWDAAATNWSGGSSGYVYIYGTGWSTQSSITSGACSGNANTSSACSGNAATAGVASSCSGNAATATNAAHATSADSATFAGTASSAAYATAAGYCSAFPGASGATSVGNGLEVTSPGLVLGVANSGITYARIQSAASDQVVLGNILGASHAFQELTATNLKTMCGYYTSGDNITCGDLTANSSVKIIENGGTAGKYLILRGGAMTVDCTYVWPAALPGAGTNKLLNCNDAGALSWVTALTSALTTNHIFAGVSSVATDCAVAGDVTMTAIGTTANFAIASGVIVNDDINASAAIATTKLGTGAVVQVVNTLYTTKATGTTIMYADDSIPQNTEGDEYFTCAITPKSATNKLYIRVVVHAATSVNSQRMAALFQDSTAGAISGVICYQSTTYDMPLIIEHFMTAGTTSATTFKVRAGGEGGTLTVNGYGGNRFLGGVMASSITITEIAV